MIKLIFINILYILLICALVPVSIIISIFTAKLDFIQLVCLKSVKIKKKFKYNHPVIIIRAASIGETLIALRLAQAATTQYNYLILLNSISSIKHLSNLIKTFNPKLLDYCQWAICPWDFYWSNRRLLNDYKPKFVCLLESEFWPGLILQSRAQDIKLISINSRISANSFRLFNYLKLISISTFQAIDLFFVAGAENIARLQHFGVDRKRIIEEISFKFQSQPEVSAIFDQALFDKLELEKHFTFVAGSVQTAELEIIVDAWTIFLKKEPHAQLIIVPRHPDKKTEFITSLAKLGLKSTKRAATWLKFNQNITIIFEFGMLYGCYTICDCAFVGGSFNKRGGQNFIEPLLAGKPTAIGPYVPNFSAEKDILLKQKAITVVESAADLTDFLLSCNNPDLEMAAKAIKAGEYISKNLVNYTKINKDLDSFLLGGGV